MTRRLRILPHVTAGVSNIPLPVLSTRRRSEIERSRDAIVRDLKSLIEGEVRFDKHDRMLYSTDASIYQVEPIGVVCPRTIGDVESVVQYCGEHHLPILPRGGGTSLAGQTVNTAVVIDFSAHLRQIMEINAAQRWVRVQPGVVLDQLNGALEPHGLMFGPDVASSSQANIGGMIGNNSAGAHSILYGRTVEHLREIDVMLSTGRRLRLRAGASASDREIHELTQRIANVIVPREAEIELRYPKIVRHVNGYNLDITLHQLRNSAPGTFDAVNLAHLVCGSEGTLAVALEATLDLVATPTCIGLALVGCGDVEDALGLLTAIIATGPSAVELVDDVVIAAARGNRECARHVALLPGARTGTPGAVLYVEYFAESESQLADRVQMLRCVADGREVIVHANRAAMSQAWMLRRAGEPLLHTLPGDRKPFTFVEDLAVDPARLSAFVRDFKRLLARHGTTAAFYAHASVGCLHIRPLVSLRDPHDEQMMLAIAREATELVKSHHGALSGEHGDGRLRSHLLEQYFGAGICEAFQHIKAIFDPRNLFNPGNIVAATSMLESFRVRPADRLVHAPRVKTYFRYGRENGFNEAIEQCNGAGVCRRMKTGTMCPSYRATLDERHATRGRGNALRLAITGQFSADGSTPAWNDPETLQTLELCLSCKACKSECPSNVDIAKLKAEFLAQGFARGGPIPLASHIFGNIRTINRLGSALHPIANAALGIAPLSALARKALNIHSARELPRFEPSLHRWFARHRRREGSHSHTLNNVRVLSVRHNNPPTVVLFPDCFTTYCEPHIGRAAILTLETLGYRVILPRLGCCGRASISTGQLAQAQMLCRQTASDLLGVVKSESAIAIVGCEPSCISAIKDDWLDLDMDVDGASLESLAARSHLVEQFIELSWDSHPCRPDVVIQENSAPVVLHAHCHQKALWGVDSSAAVLGRIFGSRLRALDSGCCGMAGSFGYARDHFDLSMAIAEQSLFHHLRPLPDGATIVAPGTSCRQQIRDGVRRRAIHPIELIAETLGAA